MANDSEKITLTADELYRYVVEESNCDIEIYVQQLLTCLGFRAKLEGTGYLEQAIVCRLGLPENAKVRYTKIIYQTVAQNNLTSTACVEHGIRTSVADCCIYGNLKVLNDLTHKQLVTEDCPPSNARLINAIAKFLFAERKLGHIK